MIQKNTQPLDPRVADLHRKTQVIDQAVENRFAIYQGDCVEVTRAIPDDSIHFTMFSPPFSSLYTYSNSDRAWGTAGRTAA